MRQKKNDDENEEENQYKVLTLSRDFKVEYGELNDFTDENSDYEELAPSTKIINDEYEMLRINSVKPRPKNNLGVGRSRNTGIPKIIEPIYEEIDQNNKEDSLAAPLSPQTTRRLSATSIGDMSSFMDTEFLKSLDNIVQALLHGIDRIHSVLLLTYEDLDTPVGKDQSYATLESIFFKPLWPWLITMFRKINWSKERLLEDIMKRNKSCNPSEMRIRDRFILHDDKTNVDGYQLAIDEIKLITSYTCPLEKLECAVRTSKLIVVAVQTYWHLKDAEKDPPSIGCDDLLPLFSYVVLKSQLPQLVAECHAMEEFIHEGYLLGEEGYCLTTLHAAISYILSLENSQTAVLT